MVDGALKDKKKKDPKEDNRSLQIFSERQPAKMSSEFLLKILLRKTALEDQNSSSLSIVLSISLSSPLLSRLSPLPARAELRLVLMHEISCCGFIGRERERERERERWWGAGG